MSDDGWTPPTVGTSSDPRVLAGSYTDGGTILIGKLVSTILGAVWLTFVGGWWAIISAVVEVHVAMINAGADGYAGIIRAMGQGGAETIRITWASAFRAAVETNPLFAPILLTLEIIAVSAIFLELRRRLG
ncbi:hypothetical protein [Haloarcula argentinensis]|uniref:Transmembrane protein n=1 Tax=Haloarcula argentinensis TaxID=43776 RepID=A0ABU2EY80_HALAR|nr:hypothetical protein [Haloarcula argentinensis]EMA24635.1 hypothetical protein C443_05734 [Haloarcula argentinensis DSM 12282]MDS0253250.1 hypothetical protein [Haloarcula argentinensis]